MKRSLSIRAYLGLSYALLLIISMGAVGIFWAVNEYQVITQELESLMLERVSLLSSLLSHEFQEYGEIRLEVEDFPIIRHEEYLQAVYFDRDGAMYELVPGSINSSQAGLFQEIVNDNPQYDRQFATLIEGNIQSTSVYASAPVHDSGGNFIGTVCLLMPLGELASDIISIRWLFFGAILVVTLLSIVISIMLTNYFSKHFSRAQNLAASVAEGNYHLRIPESGPTELRDLSQYLNQMAGKLEEQSSARQKLLANVTHELARPLAGLQLGIESLRKGAIHDPDLADDLLVYMSQTISRFEDRIDDITLAAQPETIPIELHPTALPVEPFLKGVATRFWFLADARGLKLDVKVQADLPSLYADEKRLNQILGNLMENAIKFSPDGKTIELSAERCESGFIRLLVHDSGKGISPGEAGNLFEPFYQGDIGRNIKQGMGLGLYIARQLAEVNGGHLSLENHPDGGAVAKLVLPVAIP